MEQNNEKNIVEDKGYFTDAQYEVLKHKQGNLLVSASAGSGKTSILIEKIVRLIGSGAVRLKNLLVVTFTNNASMEIKQRLFKSLSSSNDEKLLKELDDLSTSDIETFDSFCIKVVKEFGYSIGINNNFSVADESLSGYLKNQALDNIFANHNKNFDERFKNFTNNFFESRNEKELRVNIAKLYDFLRSKKDANIYKSQLDNLYAFSNDNIAFDYIDKYFVELKNYFSEQLENIKKEVQILGDEKLESNINDCINQLVPICGDFIKDFSYIRQGLNFPTIRSQKNDTIEIIEQKAKVQAIQKSINAKFGDICDSTKILSLDTISQSLQNTKKSLEYIFDIVDEFDKEYTKLKKSYQVLDFNDIEKYASIILQDEKIKTDIQNRYDWIFIDEYQDTSGLQESIVKQITTGENLFMVGDFKQSIYRFRQAEPTIFINKYNEYKNMKTSSSVIELKTNFRSAEPILKFNNFIFDKIYKQSLDGFDYKNNADLEFGGKVQQPTEQPLVKIILVDKNKDNDDMESVTDEDNFVDTTNCGVDEVYSVKKAQKISEEITSIQKQAIILADEIKNLLGQPYFDVKSNKVRHVDYGDIAVLTRNKSGVLLELKKILNTANIPVTTQYDENIFDCYDMQILFGVLNAVDNPKNDYALLTTLVNIGNLSFDELATIRKNNKKGFFYDELDRYLQNNNDTISQKVKQCFAKLEEYRNESKHRNVCDLINYVVQKEKFETYFAVNDCCDDFGNHLQILFSTIKSLQNYDLSSFLNYIETFGKNLKQESVIKDSENSVTLTNIHKSKGLEYPVVFLLTTEKAFSTKDTTAKILLDNDWGISMNSIDYDSHTTYENIVKSIFKQKIKDEDRKEEKRLLYVALTRPKNMLTIIGTTNVEKLVSNTTDFDIRESNSYLNWITGCFSQQTLDRIKACDNIDVNIDNEIINIKKVNYNDIDFGGKIQPKTAPKNLELNQKEIFDILSQKYKHNNLSKKNSVSQIMQENEHYNISNFSYNKNDKTGDEDFLSIGNAYHKFMELLHFCDNDEKIKNQIEELKKSKVKTEEYMLVDETSLIDAVKCMFSLIDKDDIVLKEQQFLTYMSAKDLIDTTEQNKILVQGVADLIIIKSDEIYLIDYKTSRLQNPDDYRKKYQTQLDIYAKSIQNFYDKPVTKKLIYSFYLNKLITIWL